MQVSLFCPASHFSLSIVTAATQMDHEHQPNTLWTLRRQSVWTRRLRGYGDNHNAGSCMYSMAFGGSTDLRTCCDQAAEIPAHERFAPLSCRQMTTTLLTMISKVHTTTATWITKSRAGVREHSFTRLILSRSIGLQTLPPSHISLRRASWVRRVGHVRLP